MTAPPGTMVWPCGVNTTEPGREQNVRLAVGALFPQQRKGNASRVPRNPCRTVATMRESTRRTPGRTRVKAGRHSAQPSSNAGCGTFGTAAIGWVRERSRISSAPGSPKGPSTAPKDEDVRLLDDGL